MPTYTHITVDHSYQDKVATITMRRAEARNAFNTQLVKDLCNAFTELRTDARLHTVVLTSDGPAFSAGADLNMMKASAAFSQEQNLNDAFFMAGLFVTINTCPVPVLAGCNGPDKRGGLGLLTG